MQKDFSQKLVDRPKRRPWFKPRQPKWVVLEPNRIGMVGGAVSATLAMLYYFVRHLSGDYMPPERVLVGAAATFVVGYGAVGIFTWYLLWVADRELPIPEEDMRIGRHRIKGGGAGTVEELPDEPAQSNEES